jgi:hypothetical protein
MATIGFLLAPLRETPASRDEKWMATVQSWIDIASRGWFDLWKTLPPEQQKDVPQMPPGTGLSTNAMDSSLRGDLSFDNRKRNCRKFIVDEQQTCCGYRLI